MSRFEQLIFNALCALIIWLPLPLASNRPWSWGVMMVAVFSLSAVWQWGLIKGRAQLHLPWRYLRWPGLLFAASLIWTGIQLLPVGAPLAHPLWQQAAQALNQPLVGTISLNPNAGMEGTLRLLAYACLFALAMQLGRNTQMAQRLLVVFVASASVIALYGVVMEASGIDRIFWLAKDVYREDVTATFINRNAFAFYCVMALLAALSLLFERIRRDSHHLNSDTFAHCAPYMAAIIILFSALLMSHSRAGLIVFTAGLAVLAALQLKRLKHAGPLIVAALAGLFGLLFILGGAPVVERFFANSDISRMALYQITLRAIGDHFWLGTGLGTFEHIFNMYRDTSLPLKGLIIDHAHNTYLENLLELGFAGAIPFFAAFCWLAALCFNGVRKRRKDTLYPALALAIGAAGAVHSMVDFPLEMPANAALFALLLGLGTGQSFSSRTPAPTKQNRAISTGFLVIFTLFATFSTWRTTIYLIQTPHATAANTLKHGRNVKEKALKALISAYIPTYTLLATPARANTLANALMHRAAVQPSAPQKIELHRKAYEIQQDALSLAPADGFGWARLAYLAPVQKQQLAALTLSIQTAPFAPTLAVFRARSGLNLWSAADLAERRAIRRQIEFTRANFNESLLRQLTPHQRNILLQLEN